MLIKQCESSIDSVPFDAPFRVSVPSRIVQIMAIYITITTAKDIVIPTKDMSALWITNRCEWCKIVKVPIEETSFQMWVLYILIPNILQFLEGALVVTIQFILIIQSDDMIELFKDFAVVQIVSELDNAAFCLADHGYLGSQLQDDCGDAERIKIADSVRPTFLGIPLRLVPLASIFIIMVGFFLLIVIGQVSGEFFHAKFKVF